MGVGGRHHTSAALCLGQRPSTHCVGGWVGRRGSLDWCGKSCSPLGLDPRTVHPMASCCINYTIPAHVCFPVGQIICYLQMVVPCEWSGCWAVHGLLAPCITKVKTRPILTAMHRRFLFFLLNNNDNNNSNSSSTFCFFFVYPSTRWHCM